MVSIHRASLLYRNSSIQWQTGQQVSRVFEEVEEVEGRAARRSLAEGAAIKS